MCINCEPGTNETPEDLEAEMEEYGKPMFPADQPDDPNKVVKILKESDDWTCSSGPFCGHWH